MGLPTSMTYSTAVILCDRAFENIDSTSEQCDTWLCSHHAAPCKVLFTIAPYDGIELRATDDDTRILQNLSTPRQHMAVLVLSPKCRMSFPASDTVVHSAFHCPAVSRAHQPIGRANMARRMPTRCVSGVVAAPTIGMAVWIGTVPAESFPVPLTGPVPPELPVVEALYGW